MRSVLRLPACSEPAEAGRAGGVLSELTGRVASTRDRPELSGGAALTGFLGRNQLSKDMYCYFHFRKLQRGAHRQPAGVSISTVYKPGAKITRAVWRNNCPLARRRAAFVNY